MTITIYVINGYSSVIGQWDLEAFPSYYEARKHFEEYINEYDAMETGTNYADNEDYTTRFWIDEIEVKLDIEVSARVTT